MRQFIVMDQGVEVAIYFADSKLAAIERYKEACREESRRYVELTAKLA